MTQAIAKFHLSHGPKNRPTLVFLPGVLIPPNAIVPVTRIVKLRDWRGLARGSGPARPSLGCSACSHFTKRAWTNRVDRAFGRYTYRGARRCDRFTLNKKQRGWSRAEQ